MPLPAADGPAGQAAVRSGAPAGGRTAMVLGLAGLLGLTVTLLEFSATRQLAPAFGQSLHVWAAVIALLLLALAAGNAGAARLRGRPRLVGALLVLGAAWTAAAAWAGPTVCGWFAPSGLPEAGGLPLSLVGSLAAAALLHAAPLAVLGLTSPLLVEASDRSGRGESAGSVYAVGTLGALLGCWLTPLVLLQVLGTRFTLLLGSAGLALGGLAFLRLPAPPPRQVPAPPVPAPQPRAGRGALLLLAATSGFAVLALELLAVRLFAPWCGQSNRIWANVIGVVLFALALGGWLGGRLARRRGSARTLSLLLAGAALSPVASVAFGPLLAEALVPRGVDAMHVLPVAFGASLALTATLFAPGALLLGAVPALLVPALAPRAGVAGAASGVSACSTLGSVVGTFLPALGLVPWLGSPRALLLVAALLAAGAVLAWPFTRWRWAGAGVALLLPAAVVLALPQRPVRVHPGQVEERESAYQSVRVVRDRVVALLPEGPPAWGGRAEQVEALFLRHDEDAETYQSLRLLGGAGGLTGGRYYEQMALGSRLARWAPGEPLRVLIVGYAGGAVHRVLLDTLPPGRTLQVLGIEIDPEVVSVARRHLDLGALEGPGLRLVLGEDARTVVNALPAHERFDLVLVDAYARTNYIPFQLATREFFRHAREHLAPGGWVGVNVLGTGVTGPVCRAVASTLADAVGPTFLHPNLWFSGNVILWSSPDPDARPRLHQGGPEDRLAPLLEVSAFALERLGARHVPGTDGGVVLTDDLSPSDRLADEELGL